MHYLEVPNKMYHMKNKKYHIDVTPEEDAWFRDSNLKVNFIRNKIFKNTILAIILGHIGVVAAVIASSENTSNTPNNLQPTPQPTPVVVPITPPPLVPLPASTPTPTIEPKKIGSDWPTAKPRVVANVKNAESNAVNPGATTQSKNLVPNFYTVKKGDTLYAICKKLNIKEDKIIKINKIKNPNSIRVNQVIKLK